jgi:hypothetical protein
MDRLKRGSLVLGNYVVEGGCSCCTTVTAKIENGMVVSITGEKCKEGKPIPKELRVTVQKARNKLMSGRNNLKLPISVSELLLRRIIDIDIGGGCIIICVFDFCYFCCVLDGTIICDRPIIVKG